MNKGIIYVISGEPDARLALRSIISLRQNGGNTARLPILLFFVGPYHHDDHFNDLGCACFQFPLQGYDTAAKEQRIGKALTLMGSPFEQFIILDSNTYIISDFGHLFSKIPVNGVIGVEAAKDIVQGFVKKTDSRQFIIDTFGIDYSVDMKYPPFYEIGVLGMSQKAAKVIGSQLLEAYRILFTRAHYSPPYDERVPFNIAMIKGNVSGLRVQPVFNYTNDQMVKDIAQKTIEYVKPSIKVIQNDITKIPWIDSKKVLEQFNKRLSVT